MVWEYYNGKIEDDLILHHKDFDKLNNNINNFELLTNSWHNVVHYPHRKDGGFFKRGRNHKITSIDSIKLEGSLFTFKTKKNGAFIVPDDVPVHGLYTGIVLGV
jgi:hypothetical protein